MMNSSFKKSDHSFGEGSDNACPVCFKDVEIFSIGVCDHPICHECSTRMRVLCKEDACPICRQDLNKVAFVKNVKPFQLLTFNIYPIDKKTRIYFENSAIQEVFEKLLVHVCHICPSKPSFSSLQTLKDHLRKEHEMFFCDLCVDNLKIFSQERRAYTRQELALHRRKGDPDNTSHRGHPLCNFCDKRYVDADELFRHLRRDHYFCHFCDADGLNQYYCNYEDLREHFRDAHFLCEEGECKEEKFTRVFRTEIDIRAHRAQTHSQSLGKAAVKQARTLELEFTLAPRPGESKARISRRVGTRPSENQDCNSSNIMELPTTRLPVVSSATVAADIGNPKEFPSLSTSSELAINSRTNGTDSLAQKIAKNNRFTVKNIVGSQDHDDFPSLVAGAQPSHNQELLVLDDRKLKEKSTGPKHSVHIRVGPHDSGNDVLMSEGPSVARVTRVSSSQNIHVQPSRDLRLENFPSLSRGSSNAEQSNLKGGWIKKDLLKPTKNTQVKSSLPGKNAPPSVDDYPVLVSSSTHGASEVGVWPTTRDSSVNLNGKKSASIVPKVEPWSEQSKINSKKKKSSSKSTSKDSTEAVSFSNGTKKKTFDVHDGIPNSSYPPEVYKNQFRKTKLDDALNAMCALEPQPIGSKVTMIKPQQLTKPVESNGAKPKVQANSVNLCKSEFPVLGSSTSNLTSFIENSKNDRPQLTKFEKPSKITFTSSSGQSFPISPPTNSPPPPSTPLITNLNRPFLQPPDFCERNQQLISTVMDLLCNQKKKIEKFRTISTQFRSGKLDPKEYYMNCLDVMGDDCFLALFPELISLLPDIAKQQQLLKVHRSEIRMKGNLAEAEPYVICATCGQVLAPFDLKHHLTNHNLETHFPSLGTIANGDIAWNKR